MDTMTHGGQFSYEWLSAKHIANGSASNKLDIQDLTLAAASAALSSTAAGREAQITDSNP